MLHIGIVYSLYFKGFFLGYVGGARHGVVRVVRVVRRARATRGRHLDAGVRVHLTSVTVQLFSVTIYLIGVTVHFLTMAVTYTFYWP